jgi:hypothetical protein
MSTDENGFRKVEWQDGQLEPSDDDDAEGLPLRARGAGIPEADLELLTLAARALGARVEVVGGENWVNLHFADGLVRHGWNSLLHSDDTVDLIACLNLAVSVNHEDHMEGNKSVVVMWNDPRNPDAGTADMHADPRVAIKRAATRAAAEIGKQRSG